MPLHKELKGRAPGSLNSKGADEIQTSREYLATTAQAEICSGPLLGHKAKPQSKEAPAPLILVWVAARDLVSLRWSHENPIQERQIRLTEANLKQKRGQLAFWTLFIKQPVF